MLNGRFWVQTIVSTIFTMVLIYAVKKVSLKYDIPVLKQVSEGV